MSRNTRRRCREAQRFGVAVLGAAALLAGTASAAGAATDIVIPLDPTEVLIGAFTIDELASVDPMADPETVAHNPVEVEFDGTLTVELPDELDDSAVGAELRFDDNHDGTPEAVFSSRFAPANPNYLTVTGQGTGSVTIELPSDDPIVGDVAELTLQPLESNLGPAFSSFGGVYFELGLKTPADPLAPAEVTLETVLVAMSQVPCTFWSGDRCPFPTPVNAGSTVTLDLTEDSALRALGLTDFTGAEVVLQQLGSYGYPDGAEPVDLDVQVSGARATVVIPAGTSAGSYGLVVVQGTPSGGLSVFNVELTVEEEAPAAAPTTQPTPQATTTVNAGLRSNTGVEVVETGSTGNVTVAAGAGLLLLAGAGGIAVARPRRRPAVEGGTCEA